MCVCMHGSVLKHLVAVNGHYGDDSLVQYIVINKNSYA